MSVRILCLVDFCLIGVENVLDAALVQDRCRSMERRPSASAGINKSMHLFSCGRLNRGVHINFFKRLILKKEETDE